MFVVSSHHPGCLPLLSREKEATGQPRTDRLGRYGLRSSSATRVNSVALSAVPRAGQSTGGNRFSGDTYPLSPPPLPSLTPHHSSLSPLHPPPPPHQSPTLRVKKIEPALIQKTGGLITKVEMNINPSMDSVSTNMSRDKIVMLRGQVITLTGPNFELERKCGNEFTASAVIHLHPSLSVAPVAVHVPIRHGQPINSQTVAVLVNRSDPPPYALGKRGAIFIFFGNAEGSCLAGRPGCKCRSNCKMSIFEYGVLSGINL